MSLLEDGTGRTILRRAVSITVLLVAFSLGIVTLPVVLPAAAALDLGHDLGRGSGRRWCRARALLFVLTYLTNEVVGVAISCFLWVVSGFGLARGAFLHWNFVLQCYWGEALKRAAMTVYGIGERVEGLTSAAAAGPVLVFMRHSSLADTVLPVSYLSLRHGIRLRWVLKRPLLWDPCLDIVGNRLPNCFVRRGAGTSSREIERVGRLGRDLGPRDGVLIYPEGTRYTAAKRERRIGDLERRGRGDAAARARRLEHSLLPEIGGPLALLDATAGSDPPVDVLFCSHVGFEKAVSVRNLVDGDLIGETFEVAFWRISRHDIPSSHEERVEWLYDQWQRVDDWVSSRAERRREPLRAIAPSA